MQSEVLPKELQLTTPPALPQARSYMFKQKSDLQEYDVSKGNKIRINIPRLQRSYLMKDSYLRFKLNIDLDGGTKVVLGNPPSDYYAKLAFDRCGAYGLFDRIEVYDYLGGTLLEQTQNLPSLATLLGDLNISLMEYNGKLNAVEGYEGSNVVATYHDIDGVEVRTSNVGKVLYNADQKTMSDNMKVFVSYEFAIPVFSFLGTYSDKYAPLHNGYSVELTLNDKFLAFISRAKADDAPTHTRTVTLEEVWLSDVEYCCQVMELGEQAEAIVMGNQPLVVPSVQYRYFTDLILGSAQQSTFALNMNLNVVSLRNLFWGMRPVVYQNLSYPSYGHRIRNFLSNWNFQYGSSYLPEIAGIDARCQTLSTSKKGYASFNPWNNKDYQRALGYNQCYTELCKTTNLSSSTTGIRGSEYMIDLAMTSSETMDDPNAAPFSSYKGHLTGGYGRIPWIPLIDEKPCSGKFAAGLNTRLSTKSTVSGIDTNGLSLTLNGTFDSDMINEMTNAILDVWAEHDSFIQVIPGVATTVTF